jgi:hypothetical protein
MSSLQDVKWPLSDLTAASYQYSVSGSPCYGVGMGRTFRFKTEDG